MKNILKKSLITACMLIGSTFFAQAERVPHFQMECNWRSEKITFDAGLSKETNAEILNALNGEFKDYYKEEPKDYWDTSSLEFGFKYFVRPGIAIGESYRHYKAIELGSYEYTDKVWYADFDPHWVDQSRKTEREGAISGFFFDTIAIKYFPLTSEQSDLYGPYCGAGIGWGLITIDEGEVTCSVSDPYNNITVTETEAGGIALGFRFQFIVGLDVQLDPFFAGIDFRYVTPISGEWNTVGWTSYDFGDTMWNALEEDDPLIPVKRTLKFKVGGFSRIGGHIGIRF